MKARQLGVLVCIVVNMLLCSVGIVQGDEAIEQADVLQTIKGFYLWAIKHGKDAVALEPVIKDVPHSNRFYLDVSSLDRFSKKFLSSGFFSPEFAAAVKKYYEGYKVQFEALPQKEFDDLKRDGRGPMMEVEDMDIFFCAQEYECTPDFVAKMRIKSFQLKGDRAEVVVISPYQWETPFSMVKRDGRWLISRYCVFQ